MTINFDSHIPLWDLYRNVFAFCKKKKFASAIDLMMQKISYNIEFTRRTDHGICRCCDQIFAQSRREAVQDDIAKSNHIEIAHKLCAVFSKNIPLDLAEDLQAQAPRSLLLYKSAFDSESAEELAKESIPRTEVNCSRIPWSLFGSVVTLCKQEKPDFDKALEMIKYDVTNLIYDKTEVIRACDQISMFSKRKLPKEQHNKLKIRIDDILNDPKKKKSYESHNQYPIQESTTKINCNDTEAEKPPLRLFAEVLNLCKQEKPDFNKALETIKNNLKLNDATEICRACDQIFILSKRKLTKEEHVEIAHQLCSIFNNDENLKIKQNSIELYMSAP
ncbi:MAG: hypothetical protein V4487_04990 [Chlamydiota bacterium]